ncbi:hypothetical protein J4402_05405 [Candidatus Pacearchaeota archaeon]|nr:hypothetical protein [Candidatus Pacearchaeota archaeon]
MENNGYKEKLEEIQKAVAGLEEPLKSKAIDKLLENVFNPTGSPRLERQLKKERTSKLKKVQSKRNESIKEDEENDKKMFETINRTEYPKIHKLETNLQRALYVLKIMKDKNYDGLNPSQIQAILTDIFGIKSNIAAISMALINDKYHTVKEKVSYNGTAANKYKIMKAGEDYIEQKILEIHNRSGLKAETSNTKRESINVSR